MPSYCGQKQSKEKNPKFGEREIYLMHVSIIGMCEKVQFDQAHLLECQGGMIHALVLC